MTLLVLTHILLGLECDEILGFLTPLHYIKESNRLQFEYSYFLFCHNFLLSH